MTRESIPVKLEPCTLDHWLHIQSSNKNQYEYWETEFEKIKLYEWMCPEIDYQYNL